MKNISVGSLLVWIFTFSYLVFFLIYPIYYVFQKTFIVNGRFSLEFFDIMLKDPVLRESIYNSFFIAFTSTFLTIIVGYVIAYALVKYDFTLKGLFQILLLLPFIVPPFVGAIGMIKLFSRFGSINILLTHILGALGLVKGPILIDWFANKILGIIFLEILHLYPIAYLNIAASISNIDPTLEESAETLGVTGFKKFITITFPLSLPGVAAASAIIFIWSFTDLGTPLMFNFFKVVPVQIFNMSREIYANPMGYALTVLVLVLTSIVFIAIKRYSTVRSYEMMGRGHVSEKVHRLSRNKQVILISLLSLWIILAVLPHISIVLMSFSDEWFLSVIPTKFTLSHYQEIFKNNLTSSSIRNSLLYSVIATIMAVFLGLSASYVSNRGKIPQAMRDLLDALSMWPLAVPGIALAFGYLSTFADFPMLSAYQNPVLILVIAYSTRRLPYMARSIYAGLQQVHRNLEEAALSLGSRPLKVIKDITIPLILANISAGAVLVFSECMIEVSTSLMLAQQEEYYPITKAIYELSTNLAIGNELASALGVILMIVVAISMVISSKVMGQKMGELFRA